jgi:hypothetical protein
MRVYLIGLNLALWKIVCIGVNIPKEDPPLTQRQEHEIHRNMQATSISLAH